MAYLCGNNNGNHDRERALPVVFPPVQVCPVEVEGAVGGLGLLPVEVVDVQVPQGGELGAGGLVGLLQVPVLTLGCAMGQ